MMFEQAKPALGQKVKIVAEAKKTKEREPWLNRNMEVKTRWVRCELEKEPEGIYIGWRTICDCDFWRGGYEEDYDEQIKNFNHRVVWLVVIDEHMNPLYVFPEDVTKGILIHE
jgi:hypothetical protein